MNMSESPTQPIESLTDLDIHLDRAIRRRHHTCPKCGKLSELEIMDYRDDRLDAVIDCSDCGRSDIVSKVSDGKRVLTIDGSVYDPSVRLQEYEGIMDSTDPKDIVFYSKACEDYARELIVFGNDPKDRVVPYLKEMTALLEHLESNGIDDLGFVCERVLGFDHIMDIDLMDVIRDICRIALDNKDDLPVALMYGIMLCKEIVDYGLDKDLHYSEEGHIGWIEMIADDFESLPQEERIDHPFIAVGAYRYLLKYHQSKGSPDDVIAGTLRKLIVSLGKAYDNGAPIDVDILLGHIA